MSSSPNAFKSNPSTSTPIEVVTGFILSAECIDIEIFLTVAIVKLPAKFNDSILTVDLVVQNLILRYQIFQCVLFFKYK